MGQIKNKNLNKSVGGRVSAARQNAGFKTSADLAAKCDVDHQTIRSVESGHITVNVTTLKRIAEVCNVSADYLLGLTDVQSTDPAVQEISKKYGLSEKALETLARIRGDYEWGAGGNPDASKARELWENTAEPLFKNREPAERNEVMESHKKDAMRFSLRRMEIIKLLFSGEDIATRFLDAIADIIDMQSKEKTRFIIPTERDDNEYLVQYGRTLKFSIAASLCDIIAQAVALNTPPETPKRGGKPATSKKEEA